MAQQVKNPLILHKTDSPRGLANNTLNQGQYFNNTTNFAHSKLSKPSKPTSMNISSQKGRLSKDNLISIEKLQSESQNFKSSKRVTEFLEKVEKSKSRGKQRPENPQNIIDINIKGNPASIIPNATNLKTKTQLSISNRHSYKSGSHTQYSSSPMSSILKK